MKYSYDVFIAYSRVDRVFVDRLVTDLKALQVRVWQDTLELQVGDQFRQKIEDAILRSRFFCFVMSNSSLRSFFVRRVELEAAFAKLLRQKRGSFILPLRLEKVRSSPLLLSTYHYLDFISKRMYSHNVKALANRILMKENGFTGSLLFKSVDTSMSGVMVGVGEPLKQAPNRGAFTRVFYESGQIRSMETYLDGKATGAKSVMYDSKGRVAEILLICNSKIVDAWKYQYDKRSGLRKFKFVCLPGEHPHQRLEYDLHGNKIAEAHMSPSGYVVNSDQGWAIKKYVRDGQGKIVECQYLDEVGKSVRTERAS
jgi:hypothetical protein